MAKGKYTGTRKFGGKRFFHYTQKASKREIELIAQNIRRHGEQARIVRGKLDGKTIYHLWVED